MRAPPLPADVVLGIAGWLVGQGELAAAALVVTGFNCFLRTGELLLLRRAHVRFAASHVHGVWLFSWTKSGERTGAPESVFFNDPLVSRLLDLACARVIEAERIFPSSGSRFRHLFESALQALQLDGRGYRPYSLRRGRATAEFLEHGSATTTQLRSRWASLMVCTIYVTLGQESLANIACPPESLRLWALHAHSLATLR